MAGALAYGEGILSSPSVATPWVEFADDYTGQCVQSGDGTDVLAVRLLTRAAPALTPSPNADWGLHVDDSNIALGNLVEVVEQQALAYRARR